MHGQSIFIYVYAGPCDLTKSHTHRQSVYALVYANIKNVFFANYSPGWRDIGKIYEYTGA